VSLISIITCHETYGLTSWPSVFDEPLKTIFDDAHLTDEQITAIKTEFKKRITSRSTRVADDGF
jgi:hypothetical protein